MRRLGVGLLAAAALSVVSPQARSTPVVSDPPQPRMIFDNETDCSELEPDVSSALIGTERATNVDLDLLLLLDGVGDALAAKIVAKAAESYSPLAITLKARYEHVTFSGVDATALIAQAKAHVGGQRPAGIDIVHVMTSKDIENRTFGRSLLGLADCIGGVELPARAFSVAEARPEAPVNIGGIKLFLYLYARVTAHEVGHLMGAHHHYSSCVEGIPSEALELEASPCTLMINDAGLASNNFSVLNATIVRGHAIQFAKP